MLPTSSQETRLWKCVCFYEDHCELQWGCSGLFSALHLTSLHSLGQVSPLPGANPVTRHTLDFSVLISCCFCFSQTSFCLLGCLFHEWDLYPLWSAPLLQGVSGPWHSLPSALLARPWELHVFLLVSLRFHFKEVWSIHSGFWTISI